MSETATKEHKTLEETVGVDFPALTSRIKKFPDSAPITSLHSRLNEIATTYFHKGKDAETGKLTFNGKNDLKEFSESLWMEAADHIAQKYLGLTADKLKELKASKDPSDPKKTLYESFIEHQVGLEKTAFYDAVKSRKTITARDIEPIINQLYEAHVNTATSKMITSSISDVGTAQALLKYLHQLKAELPEAFKNIKLPEPGQIKNVQEVQGLYGNIVSALPPDYTKLLNPKATEKMGPKLYEKP